MHVDISHRTELLAIRINCVQSLIVKWRGFRADAVATFTEKKANQVRCSVGTIAYLIIHETPKK